VKITFLSAGKPFRFELQNVKLTQEMAYELRMPFSVDIKIFFTLFKEMAAKMTYNFIGQRLLSTQNQLPNSVN
jgi:hypothetical protein